MDKISKYGHGKNNWLIINGLELKRKISADFGIPEEKIDDYEFLSATIDFFKKSGAEVFDRLDYEFPSATIDFFKKSGTEVSDSSHRDFSRMLYVNPLGYITINVKKSVWTLLGLILDIFFTKGGATATLAALGIIGQCIGKLHEENGELCVYKELMYNKAGKTTKQIYNSLRLKCLFNDFDCKFREEGSCSISMCVIQENLRHMSEIGAVTQTTDGKWKVEL